MAQRSCAERTKLNRKVPYHFAIFSIVNELLIIENIPFIPFCTRDTLYIFINILYIYIYTIADFILQLPTTRVSARTKMADYDNLLTSPASRFRRTCWQARPADRLETRKHLRSSGKPLVPPRERKQPDVAFLRARLNLSN